jgi:hypothetical protein
MISSSELCRAFIGPAFSLSIYPKIIPRTAMLRQGMCLWYK